MSALFLKVCNHVCLEFIFSRDSFVELHAYWIVKGSLEQLLVCLCWDAWN